HARNLGPRDHRPRPLRRMHPPGELGRHPPALAHPSRSHRGNPLIPPMTAFGRFSLRLGLYLLVAAYLAGDLFLFNGPLNRHLRRSQPDSPEAIAAAKAKGVVARVYGYTITRSQLDRAIHE